MATRYEYIDSELAKLQYTSSVGGNLGKWCKTSNQWKSHMLLWNTHIKKKKKETPELPLFFSSRERGNISWPGLGLGRAGPGGPAGGPSLGRLPAPPRHHGRAGRGGAAGWAELTLRTSSCLLHPSPNAGAQLSPLGPGSSTRSGMLPVEAATIIVQGEGKGTPHPWCTAAEFWPGWLDTNHTSQPQLLPQLTRVR